MKPNTTFLEFFSVYLYDSVDETMTSFCVARLKTRTKTHHHHCFVVVLETQDRTVCFFQCRYCCFNNPRNKGQTTVKRQLLILSDTKNTGKVLYSTEQAIGERNAIVYSTNGCFLTCPSHKNTKHQMK